MARTAFDPHGFDIAQAQVELAEFKKLLDTNTDLKERDQVLSGFAKWPNLCAMFGLYHGRIRIADRIRREFTIGQLFRADLAVAKSGTDYVCLVEFEGASAECIFRPGKRKVDEWAQAFEKGFSQVVDWAWAVENHRLLPEFKDAFGSEWPDYQAVLVIGRDTALDGYTPRDRWKWRGRAVTVSGRPVTLVTFDELFLDFDTEIKSRLVA